MEHFLSEAMYDYRILKHSTMCHIPFLYYVNRHQAVPPVLKTLLGDNVSLLAIKYKFKLANTLLKRQATRF